MREYRQILLTNKAWAAELVEENPRFFSDRTAAHRSHFLWIGSTDSRVSPEQMTQTLPGGMLTHNNVGNLVSEDDLNLMSVLQYALEVLTVPNIVLCGHHGCGGIAAALSGDSTGPVDRWLEPARAVARDHAAELDALPEGEARINRLVELNVREQVIRLARTPLVRAAFDRGQPLALHGVVYDIRDGLLKPLMEIDAATPLDAVGRPPRVLAG